MSKPDPEFFRRAVSDTNRRVELALSVGDRVENDVSPAHAAGLHAVFLDRHDAAPDIDVPSIASLSELPGLVEFAG